MKLSMRNSGQVIAIVQLLFLSGILGSVTAAKQVVKFGGTLGNTYSPNSFTIMVGDTITWEGNFTMHPLSSTTIPATAAAWSVTSGTTFSYIVKVPGNYHYQCDLHISLGMIGSFTASTPVSSSYSSFPGKEPLSADITTVSGRPYIRFTTPISQKVTMRVMDFRGRVQGPIMFQNLTEGMHMVPLDAKIKAFGSYIIDIRYATTVENIKVFRSGQ